MRMELKQHKSIGRPKLIIVCGLSGSGKTTHAKTLEEELGAVRFNPDEWMQTLSINLHDEDWRAKIEALQWQVAQDLSATVDVLFERVQRRGLEDPPLTREDLVRCSQVFQVPTAVEIALFDAYQG